MRTYHSSQQHRQRNSTGCFERCRKRERPKKIWLDDIKQWTYVPLRDLLEATHDRDQWRRVVGEASRNAPFLTIWGWLAGEKIHLKLLTLVSSYLRNPKERFDTLFGLGVIPIKCPFFSPFGGCWEGKSPPKTAGFGNFLLREPQRKILHCF